MWQQINHHLMMLGRARSGRDASPSAVVIDNQSAKTTQAGGPRGYDAGKKIKGRKRHALVDTDGRALVLHLSGGIDFGTARDFEALLDASHRVRTVDLSSSGGRVA